jgi:Ca2+-binding EF-hand superfamily protein
MTARLLTRPLLALGLVAAAALLLVPWSAAADEEKPKDTPAVTELTDLQDIVYLGDKRPLVIRLRVQVDGKSFQTPWQSALKDLFDFYDRDGDGGLDEKEAARLPSPQELMQGVQFRGRLLLPGGGGRGPGMKFQDLDADGDGKVTLEELDAYYRKQGAGPLTVQPAQQFRATAPDLLTDVLFNLLDTNKDGKLSKEELQAAEKTLRKFDTDDDELVSAAELLQGAGNPNAGTTALRPPAGVRPGRPGMAAGLPDNSPFFVVLHDGSPKRFDQRMKLAEKLIAQYDKDNNGKLDRGEIGLDKKAFDRLDTNHDGQLDVTELLKILNPPMDAEVVLRLGKVAGKEAVSEVVSTSKSMETAVRKAANGTITLAVGQAEIELLRQEGVAGGNGGLNFAGQRQFVLQQFRALDKDKKGFVEKEQLKDGMGQFQFLQPLFDQADRDGDGKLTEKELTTYLDLQDRMAASPLTLSIGENGQGLFELLDANRDGRLGIRELRTAWERLKVYDLDGDGCISRNEIPRQFQVSVGRGQPNQFGRPLQVAGGGVRAPDRPVTGTKAGPLWFRMMDRNGDGDVSRREWLGTREEFDRIDKDGDGLISLEEAIAAEKEFAKPAPKP